MTGPLTISVILPTRDRPALLVEALESVLAQRLSPDEVIVVDDGGRGEAERVVSGLCGSAPPSADGRPTIAVGEGPGRGPGAARNAGLRLATGELVAFLDDDDLWHPEKLAFQAPWFARVPSLGVLGTEALSGPQAMWPRGDGSAGEEVKGSQAKAHSAGSGQACGTRVRVVGLRAMVRANELVTSSVMARRECLEGCGGFDESLPLAQDWDLWLRIAQPRSSLLCAERGQPPVRPGTVPRWQLALLPAPLVFYRRHGEQRSADARAMRACEGEVLRRALARKGWDRHLSGIARRRLAWSHVRLGRLLARGGEHEAAREQFREAMALCWFSPVAWSGTMRCALVKRALARART